MKSAADTFGPFMDVVTAMKEMEFGGYGCLIEQIRLARGKLGTILEHLETTTLSAAEVQRVRERCDFVSAEIDELLELAKGATSGRI